MDSIDIFAVTQKGMDDTISRQAAIRWVKTECNPYGKPTLDFESGKKVIEHLKQMPSAQPDLPIKEKCAFCPHCNNCDVNDDLSIQPCVDTISRQDAINTLHDEIVRRRINEDSNDDGALDEFDTEAILRRLPPAQPQRKKGHWIYLDKDKRFFHPHIVKCSVCNNTLDMYGVNAGRGDANFCPNCGTRMEGES